MTSRDPADLRLGQLSDIQNCVYRTGSPALHRAIGRVAFAAVSASGVDVVGIRDMLFDNANHYLVAHASNLYSTATVGDSGTFQTATTAAGSGLTLESAHFDNSFFFFNGGFATASSDRNRVAYLSATATATNPSWRPHGMRPVSTTLAPITATGTWTAPATGIYEYWYTEVALYTKDGVAFEIESTYNPPENDPPGTVSVSATSQSVKIPIPEAPINPEATRFYVYRSVRKESLSDTSFPDGQRIGRGTFGTDVLFTDGVAVTGSYNGASATAAGPGAVWANSQNATSENDTYASHTGTTPGYLAFLFPTITVTEPVVGIQVEVDTNSTNPVFATSMMPGTRVALSNDSGATFSPFYISESRTGSTPDFLYTFGSTGSKWGLQWDDGKFTAGVFRVLLEGSLSGTVNVDYVRVRVIDSGTVPEGDEVFPAVVIEESGVTSSVGRHGKPPIATTADLFEDQLVTNDIQQPSFIRYSTPGNPESFPELYFVDFETQDNDQVTNIKALNNRLGVFLRHAIYRMNYLPNELDANFDRGRCQELVSSDLGCVNPMCACRYTGHDGRAQVAFVSDTGIYTTDLFSVSELTDALAWRSILATANSEAIDLINDPEKRELVFHFRNDALGNETMQALHLNYSDEHMVQGKPKISGPVHVRNYDSGTTSYANLKSAWPVRRSSGTTSVYLGYGGAATATAAGAGKVFIETGSTIPANDPAMSFRTRRLYLAGIANEWKLGDLYGYVSNQSGAQTLTYTPFNVKTNDTTGEVTQTSKTAVLGGQILHKVPFHLMEEGLRIDMAVTSGHADLSFENLTIEGEDFGEEDSGK